MLLNGGELNGKRLLGPAHRRAHDVRITRATWSTASSAARRAAWASGSACRVVLDPVAADLAVSKGAFSWPGGSGVAFWIEPKEELVSIYMIQGGSGADSAARVRERDQASDHRVIDRAAPRTTAWFGPGDCRGG